MGLMGGQTLGNVIWFYLQAFLSLYLYFAVIGMIDTASTAEELKITLADFLENRMSERLAQVKRAVSYTHLHKPWWKRLFSGFRKSKSVGEECEEVSVSRMDQMVWDSYEQQLYENGSQETVYFADLDSMTEQYDGLYCLNAQGKEQRIVLKGLPLTIGKLKGRCV